MKVIGVAGPADAGRPGLVERLVERLSKHGRVGTVRDDPDAGTDPGADHRAAGAAATYGVSEDGRWVGTGEDASLDGVLDGLAPECDYAVVEGFPRADLPRIVLGNRETEGTVLAAAETADGVDLDDVVEELRGGEPHETLESLVARAKRSPEAERAGAIATFTGRVRARDAPDDEPTEFLEFEKYEGVAADRMDHIVDELTDREGVFEVLLHHRTGVIEYGEDIVFVVVLAGHREEAFRTVEDGINRLKDEVPIFKREVTVEEEFWVHERE
ncbi:molybdopterin synthase [Halobacteriales archaeon QS_8_69_26]|nr:MAG: molybdopterin synthase [Halobacteriales archaeon QS_8_69_26]